MTKGELEQLRIKTREGLQQVKTAYRNALSTGNTEMIIKARNAYDYYNIAPLQSSYEELYLGENK